MKTTYAPDTAPALLELARDLAADNPAAVFIGVVILCAALASLAVKRGW